MLVRVRLWGRSCGGCVSAPPHGPGDLMQTHTYSTQNANSSQNLCGLCAARRVVVLEYASGRDTAEQDDPDPETKPNVLRRGANLATGAGVHLPRHDAAFESHFVLRSTQTNPIRTRAPHVPARAIAARRPRPLACTLVACTSVGRRSNLPDATWGVQLRHPAGHSGVSSAADSSSAPLPQRFPDGDLPDPVLFFSNFWPRLLPPPSGLPDALVRLHCGAESGPGDRLVATQPTLPGSALGVSCATAGSGNLPQTRRPGDLNFGCMANLCLVQEWQVGCRIFGHPGHRGEAAGDCCGGGGREQGKAITNSSDRGGCNVCTTTGLVMLSSR